MMNIDYSEQLLLSELFSSSKKRLQSYTLLNRLGLQEATFFKLIVRLKDKQLIEFHDIYLELTPLGIDTLIHQQYTKKLNQRYQMTSKTPTELK